jgi:hypothetical protein
VRKSEGKRPKRRWEDNIKMDNKEIGREGIEYIPEDREK